MSKSWVTVWIVFLLSTSTALLGEMPPGLAEQVAKLTAVDAGASDRFGYSVSIDGRTAIIGAPFDDDSADNSGAAYIFEQDEVGH